MAEREELSQPLYEASRIFDAVVQFMSLTDIYGIEPLIVARHAVRSILEKNEIDGQAEKQQFVRAALNLLDSRIAEEGEG